MAGSRRERGDGSLFLRANAKGGETWIGFWRVDGRGLMRSVGPKRSKAQPGGLTQPQAEAPEVPRALTRTRGDDPGQAPSRP